MKSKIQRLVLGFILGTQVLFFQNCSNTRFTGDNGGAFDKLACQPDLEKVSKPVKIFFLVDTSGSNVPNDYFAPSDIDKSWRAGVLNSVIQKYQSNSNIFYGLATFQDVAAKAQIKDANGKAIFTNDLNQVRQGVQNFMNTPDADRTPYKAALALAKQAIAEDIAAHPGENAAYSLVMLSDGIPSDQGYNYPSDVIPDAQSIMNLSPGMIRLNTVFYYGQSVNAGDTEFLKNISTTGHGSFLVANSHDAFSIDDLIQYAQKECVAP